ncbi:NADP dehydrogenase [ubiquinone] 1 beta subcomplex subunit 5, mitochondrial [Plakobranchus ocellatus]|uniref:NADP dehydrogenase [ubiquinone] 1 beta subcomplex subunit 5, mitochondrial n=1 Tax=Plakobranchus ocellatus TaxID=259542 RepID=A0AAV4AJK1_9GAST|nr:NADP dehydrogenase [ubiquinone] 1 beta subcomplex subunit 5, mitochondrial [Plakobranchus ocellatus]
MMSSFKALPCQSFGDTTELEPTTKRSCKSQGEFAGPSCLHRPRLLRESSFEVFLRYDKEDLTVQTEGIIMSLVQRLSRAHLDGDRTPEITVKIIG